ncbi:hypothetical protein H8356DRAFT_1676497 [Neocallimastix lanati (nom. inval.)]|nr:hypothetical protein H8356DRAFT_1676497 [Neocallimastix sp. JGI-2020a]
MESKDKRGYTPLIYALIYGHLDVIKYLTKQGANIENKSNEGRTPLLLTIICGNI